MNWISTKKLTPNLTSYDLLKSFALITMIIDHVGSYWFPDEDWLRLIGRMSFPIWLFFVGYAKSRDLSPALWICAFSVSIGGVVLGYDVLAVNVLFSIILVRLVLDRSVEFLFHSSATLWLMPALCVALALPTSFLFEYGTIALMIAMLGWMIRNKNELPKVRPVLPWFFGVTFFAHYTWTYFTFGFIEGEAIVLSGLLGVSYIFIYFFEIKTYPTLMHKLPSFMVLFLQFMGRHSLYIYTVHVILFMLMAMWLNPEKTALFQ